LNPAENNIWLKSAIKSRWKRWSPKPAKPLLLKKSYFRTVGKPFIAGGTVTGKVLKQGRGAKVHVLKFKPKSKYRRKIGHRQAYTEIEIIKA
jgi:ribosomal protein L21